MKKFLYFIVLSLPIVMLPASVSVGKQKVAQDPLEEFRTGDLRETGRYGTGLVYKAIGSLDNAALEILLARPDLGASGVEALQAQVAYQLNQHTIPFLLTL